MLDQTIFTQLSLVIVIVAIVSLVMRALRQPLIIGYILTGVLAGPSFLHLIRNNEAFEAFSEVGIALLLFIIGLGLSVNVIKSLGRVVLITSAIIASGIGIVGYTTAAAFGLGGPEALITAIALLFSSTIIVIKVLSDKKEQSRLYGQLAVGILLVEDIVATIALLVIAANGGGGDQNGYSGIAFLMLKALGVGLFLWLMVRYVIPRLTKSLADSQEALFIFAIGWGFGVASLFEQMGLSMEVGALFAGVALSSLHYASEISARLKPLRDFFIVLFFIALGEQLRLGDVTSYLLTALALSIVVLVFKPLLTMAALGFLGYTKRTSFKTAIHLSQISEFSIIFVVVAASYQIVSPQLASMITLVAIISIGISAYLMKYDDQLYTLMERNLRFFERKVVHGEKKVTTEYPLVLFGYRKGGHEFVRAFKEMKKRYIIVDYSPEVIETLEHQHLPFVYGDATDFELLQEINIHSAKLVVSTITDFETNSVLVRHVHHVNPKSIIVCHADNFDQAAQLYEHGATYVMLPHLIGSERISQFIRRQGTSKEAFERYRTKHLVGLGRTAVHNHHHHS